MIPKVARGSQSFDDAGLYYLRDKAKNDFAAVGGYVLHDKQGRQTAYRVGFTTTLNMEAQHPWDAIGQMTASYDRYREKEAHKRGRKLTKPVFVYSLAWAPDQNPSQADMMDAARTSLKALRLEGLQTLIIQHTDEPQPHIHVMVNRIELDGSRARNIAYDQLRLSRWAEQYERDHGGIRCEQRVTNNDIRRQGIMVKDTISLTRAEYTARERAQKAAVENWRKEQDAFLKESQRYQREGLWQRHVQERNGLEAATHARVAADREASKAKFQPQWRALYRQQDIQKRILTQAIKGGIFDRACFVFSNRDFLSKAGPLRLRDLARLCLSSKALKARVERVHTGERAALAKWERKLSDTAVGIAWREHAEAFSVMRSRQQLERDGLVYVQQAERDNYAPQPEPIAPAPEPQQAAPAPELIPGENFAVNDLGSLLTDGQTAQGDFNAAAHAVPPKRRETPEEFKERLRDYKRRHPNRDFGRKRRR